MQECLKNVVEEEQNLGKHWYEDENGVQTKLRTRTKSANFISPKDKIDKIESEI